MFAVIALKHKAYDVIFVYLGRGEKETFAANISSMIQEKKRIKSTESNAALVLMKSIFCTLPFVKSRVRVAEKKLVQMF